MNTATLNDAKELIGLAQRMGIPTKEAISSVMRMAEPRRLVRRRAVGWLRARAASQSDRRIADD